MNKLQVNETNKLHYGKYLYKLKIYNQLSHIFRTELQRNGKLSYAKQRISEYFLSHKNGDYIYRNNWGVKTHIAPETLIDANEIFKVLKLSSDYLVRCETHTIIVYSNNKTLLLKLANKTKYARPELWEPAATNIDFLKNNTNVILIDKPSLYPFKISFGRKKGKPELAKWIKANLDKVQAGVILLKNLEDSGWIQGQYIYARDEGIVFLIQMIAGDNITRIDKLVYKANLDK
tara:strand:- start:75 stop:773 length:699 start_codon:yes stop_codon:yes gene_type:complete